MKQRKIYPAIFRWAYAIGKEHEFISAEDQKNIPKQTKSNWRNLSPSELDFLEEELQISDKLVSFMPSSTIIPGRSFPGGARPVSASYLSARSCARRFNPSA